jgi:low affinity Fe/Cu permease
MPSGARLARRRDARDLRLRGGRLWLMTLFIQRAEHRDTQAIQAKLDELLKANHDAENEITRVDEKEPEEIEDFREGQRRGI